MNQERIDCTMRHIENGNCLPLGGFCTSVSDEICHALHNAYMRGECDEDIKWYEWFAFHTIIEAEQSKEEK